ncbi:MAG: NAD(P)/FAD-dependent oxidoreductase [Clostridiales bacterium]|nr:NAD(P)/FAD-dependent oxidoreductase [Clostridiales bacterium]
MEQGYRKAAVIGGGPGGIMAAIRLSELGIGVVLYEKTPRLLNKLRISGKGRCNLTNASDREEFLSNILRGARFFQSAFSRFHNYDLMDYVESLGVPLKTERGNRVFPVSDRAADIADALTAALKHNGVSVRLNCPVTAITPVEDGFQITAGGKTRTFSKVILATGGKSYPGTGSTGDGYGFAASLGHSVTELAPSLAPIITVETWPKEAAGLSLKNVGLYAYQKGKRVFYEQGEMLFTHNGVSGPLVLSASCHLDGALKPTLSIDLKPALTEEQLDARLLRDFERYANREARNALGDLLPRSLIPIIVRLWGAGEKVVNQLTRQERQALISLLKGLPLTVKQIGPMEAAIVTRGGVNLKEINPRTMESKVTPGLYFAGELMDLDGYTGGFNLQIAFATGSAAGISCAEALLQKEA